MENLIKDITAIVFSLVLLVCSAVSCAHGASLENAVGIAASALALTISVLLLAKHIKEIRL